MPHPHDRTEEIRPDDHPTETTDRHDEPLPACCPPAADAPCQACTAPIDLPEWMDPGDARSDPALWGDEHDDWTWELGAGDEPDDVTEWRAEAAAREHLDASRLLSLPELAEHLAQFFGTWGNGAGEMLAAAMTALALKVRLTGATTPEEYAARIDSLDDDIRQQWRDQGFEEGLQAGRREHSPRARYPFGHET